VRASQSSVDPPTFLCVVVRDLVTVGGYVACAPGPYGRLTHDYEILPASFDAMIHLAMINKVGKRTTDETTPTW